MCGVGAIVRRWSRRRGLRLPYSWSQVLPGFEQAADVHARQGERDERDQHARGGAGADVERHERLLIGEDADRRGRLAGASLGDEPDLVEHVEVPDHRQHRDDYQARLDQRHGDLLVAAQL